MGEHESLEHFRDAPLPWIYGIQNFYNCVDLLGAKPHEQGECSQLQLLIARYNANSWKTSNDGEFCFIVYSIYYATSMPYSGVHDRVSVETCMVLDPLRRSFALCHTIFVSWVHFFMEYY